MGQFKINFKKPYCAMAKDNWKQIRKKNRWKNDKIHISSVTMWMPRAHMYR